MSSNQKTYCRKEILSTSLMYNKKNINNIDLQCNGLNKVVNENIVENIIENDNLLTDRGNNCLPVDELIQQLRSELKQTRELITELESRLRL
ncbi:35244_t:CDS:2 [Racocetra persica]|uniref:35244_t:CDS:1 n=1 Tax=Racocetra persica TaxID=160502 RepID=A0ACA9NQK2_9GLOM|nr:35244_t:CDS:2 [Racocetra persica]